MAPLTAATTAAVAPAAGSAGAGTAGKGGGTTNCAHNFSNSCLYIETSPASSNRARFSWFLKTACFVQLNEPVSSRKSSITTNLLCMCERGSVSVLIGIPYSPRALTSDPSIFKFSSSEITLTTTPLSCAALRASAIWLLVMVNRQTSIVFSAVFKYSITRYSEVAEGKNIASAKRLRGSIISLVIARTQVFSHGIRPSLDAAKE
mmetsp:Transcript_13675/g.25802  ORF Transcript_13675/g.25802 Transcript_13675/m.25802 type:complete len:205 (-) Transcript_13675:215-829(-)